MLNSPWVVANNSAPFMDSNQMVVQTHSVSISSGDGSLIQTNTYESWVTVTAPQAVGFDLAPSIPTANLPANVFTSLDVGTAGTLHSPCETYLAVPDPVISIPPVTVQTPFVAQHNAPFIESIVALPSQVQETSLVAAVDPTETYIAVPVPNTCNSLVPVSTVPNLYSPLIASSQVTPNPGVGQFTTSTLGHDGQPSWLIVVPELPESRAAVCSTVESNLSLATTTSAPLTGFEYRCQMCLSSFEKLSSLEWHSKSCNGLVQDVEAKSVSPMDISTTSTIEFKSLICLNCKGTFNVMDNLISAHPFVCVDCKGKTTINNISFNFFLKKEFECADCDECFDYKTDLEEHRSSIHKSSVTICELPDNYVSDDMEDVSIKIESPIDYEKEGDYESITEKCDAKLVQLSNDTTLHCGVCEKIFTKKKTLVKHERSHKKINSYGCEKCGKFFSGTYNLKRHIRTHLKKERVGGTAIIAVKEAVDELTSQPYGCAECGKQFSSSDSLKEHCVSHLRSKPFSCTLCGENFENTDVLERHWRLHSRNKI